MFSQREPVYDLKAQVLGQILKQKSNAINYHNHGRSWEGIEALYTLSNDLVLDDDEYEEVDKIMEVRDEIIKEAREYANNIPFADKTSIADIAIRRRQVLSKPIFTKILRELNKIMKKAKYYQFMMDGNYKNFKDPSRGRKSFTRG